MTGEYGIENVKHIIKALATLGCGVGDAYADGVINAADLKEAEHLIPMFSELTATKFSLLLPEAKDISPEEGQEIVMCFGQYFDIPQDNLENAIEYVLAFLASGVAFVGNLMKMIKKPIVTP